MRILLPEQWKPADKIILEDAAKDAIYTKDNVLVLAGPGAGKTELLAQKAGFLFSTNSCCYPRKILAISFKNDAADNLKKRVVNRYGNEINSRFISQTYDAFAKGIVDRFRLALPKGIIPKKDYIINDMTIINKAFIKSGYKHMTGEKASKTRENYEKIIESVNFPLVKNNLETQVWKLLLNGFENNPACLTFKMISMLATLIIKQNSKLKKAIQLTYSHVFLDEFQDTTSLQYELIKTCFINSNCVLTAVGDNKQRIMLWAGAKKSIFEDFKSEFYAKEKKLVINHRSAPRLVALQKDMYNSLNDNSCVEISNKWNKDDGEIELFISKDDNVESYNLALDIQSKINEGMTPSDICILCKQKPLDYTKKLISVLSELGIRARVETEYQDLIKEPIIALLISVIRLSIDIKNPKDWNFVNREFENLWGINFFHNINTSDFKLQEKIYDFITKISKKINNIETKTNFIEFIKFFIDSIDENRIIAQYPIYSQKIYLRHILDNFCELFWEELQIANFKWRKAIDGFNGLLSIPIMTIHKSKGLEYSIVYFLGLEDAAFWNFKKQPEEDRCAFFVALSRAKNSVKFTYCKYRETLKYPNQKIEEINEFFTLLKKPGCANIKIF